jgi:hypothetical protein
MPSAVPRESINMDTCFIMISCMTMKMPAP